MVEHLMIEDATIENLTVEDEEPPHERSYNFTCKECQLVTKSKDNLAEHVIDHHTQDKNEEVRFVCTLCAKEFQDSENYDTHAMTHVEPKETEKDFTEAENRAFLLIIEHLPAEDIITRSSKCSCKKCEQLSKISIQNK